MGKNQTGPCETGVARSQSRYASSQRGGLTEVGPLRCPSDGGHVWLLERRTLDYQPGKKMTFLFGNGVLDKWLYLLEMGFHHLETKRYQPYGSALLSAALGSDGISCVLVDALSGDFLQSFGFGL